MVLLERISVPPPTVKSTFLGNLAGRPEHLGRFCDSFSSRPVARNDERRFRWSLRRPQDQSGGCHFPEELAASEDVRLRESAPMTSFNQDFLPEARRILRSRQNGRESTCFDVEQPASCWMEGNYPARLSALLRLDVINSVSYRFKYRASCRVLFM